MTGFLGGVSWEIQEFTEFPYSPSYHDPPGPDKDAEHHNRVILGLSQGVSPEVSAILPQPANGHLPPWALCVFLNRKAGDALFC